MHEMYASGAFLAANLEYVVEPTNLCVISSNVGDFWGLLIMSLLRSLESRHTFKVPLVLQGNIGELTQGVGSILG